VFADQVAVDIRDRNKVKRFVTAFLTDPDFFPARGRPLTRWTPNDSSLETAAEELYDDLQKVVQPDDDDEQMEEWPAVAFVRLGLTASQVREITDTEDEDATLVTSRLLLEATVLSADREAAALFGRPALPVDELFGKILPRAVRDGEPPAWLRSLVEQVTRAAQWSFPVVRWGLMRSANENTARGTDPSSPTAGAFRASRCSSTSTSSASPAPTARTRSGCRCPPPRCATRRRSARRRDERRALRHAGPRARALIRRRPYAAHHPATRENADYVNAGDGRERHRGEGDSRVNWRRCGQPLAALVRASPDPRHPRRHPPARRRTRRDR